MTRPMPELYAATMHRCSEDDDRLLDDQTLIARALAHPARFAPLYQRYLTRVYSYVRTRVGSEEDAADLTQQVFLRALVGCHDRAAATIVVNDPQAPSMAPVSALRMRRLSQESGERAAGRRDDHRRTWPIANRGCPHASAARGRRARVHPCGRA
jgi:hypothetical protein